MAPTQTILLVENETLILNFLRDAFTDAGYAVVVANTGAKALRELETGADRFGGIVTDIKLGPGPDGWSVGHRARELYPYIRVVYVSGDSGREWLAKGVPDSMMIAKPYAAAEVVTAFPPTWFRRGPLEAVR